MKAQKFALIYDGNGLESARSAGYEGGNHALAVSASRLLRDPRVRDIIAQRTEADVERFILSREERQELWSQLALDTTLDASDRLKALELLGKSQADFTEKLEVKGDLTLRDLLRESMGKD
jgi:phage terminase small subunit